MKPFLKWNRSRFNKLWKTVQLNKHAKAKPLRNNKLLSRQKNETNKLTNRREFRTTSVASGHSPTELFINLSSESENTHEVLLYYMYCIYIIVLTPNCPGWSCNFVENDEISNSSQKRKKIEHLKVKKQLKYTQRNCCSGRRADIQLESSNRMTTRSLPSSTPCKIDRTRLNPKLILSQKWNDLAKVKLLSYFCNQGWSVWDDTSAGYYIHVFATFRGIGAARVCKKGFSQLDRNLKAFWGKAFCSVYLQLKRTVVPKYRTLN